MPRHGSMKTTHVVRKTTDGMARVKNNLQVKGLWLWQLGGWTWYRRLGNQGMALFSAVLYKICGFACSVYSCFYFCFVCVLRKGLVAQTGHLLTPQDDFGLLVSGTNTGIMGCAATPSLEFRNSDVIAKLTNQRLYLEPKNMRRPAHIKIRNVFLNSLDYIYFFLYL